MIVYYLFRSNGIHLTLNFSRRFFSSALLPSYAMNCCSSRPSVRPSFGRGRPAAVAPNRRPLSQSPLARTATGKTKGERESDLWVKFDEGAGRMQARTVLTIAPMFLLDC